MTIYEMQDGKDANEFEDIIQDLGGFGHWQRVIFTLISVMDVMGAMSIILPVFTGATPRWRCDDSLTLNSTGESPLVTSQDNLTWETCTPEGVQCHHFTYNDSFSSIVSEWDLVCDRAYVSDLITSIQMGGLMFGAAAFGQLSDTIGRKKSYFLAYTIMIGFGALSAASVNWQMYAALRFLVGVGFGATMVVNCVYTVEFVGTRWRTFCGTVGFWAVGVMVTSLVAYLLRDWRQLILASSVSGVGYYLAWWWIPESPRWLAERGKLEECEKIVAIIAKKNNKTVDMASLKRFLKKQQAREECTKKYTYLDLFHSWKYTKRTIVLLISWFTTFLMYYQLTYNIKNLAGDRYINLFLGGVVDLLSLLSVILFNNYLGRRLTHTMFLSMALMSNLVLLTVYKLGKEDELGGVIVGFAMLGRGVALASTYCMQIYTAELYPTVIRNVGMGIGSIAGRLGGVAAPQIVFLGTKFLLAPYIIVSALCALALPVTFVLPETSQIALEDTFVDKNRDPENNDQVLNGKRDNGAVCRL